MPTIREIKDNPCYAYGLHSNIPECCVIRFVEDTLDGMVDIAYQRFKKYGVTNKELNNGHHGFFYVPCEKCWKSWLEEGKKANKIHVCTKGNPTCNKFRTPAVRWYRKHYRNRFTTD